MDEGTVRFRIKIWWEHLTSEQKVAGAILAVCGVLAVALSATQLKAQVTAPFMVSKQVLAQAQSIVDAQPTQDQVIEDLKQKDTDHDGLSDYDEIYIYHSSPYLVSTASDGIPDVIKIADGMDPNCPYAKPCSNGADLLPQAASSSLDDLLTSTPVPTVGPDSSVGGNASGTSGAQAFVDHPPPPASMKPAQIRQYFIDHQLATQAQLNQLTDPQVLQLYQAAYADALRVQAARAGAPPAGGQP